MLTRYTNIKKDRLRFTNTTVIGKKHACRFTSKHPFGVANIDSFDNRSFGDIKRVEIGGVNP